MSSRWQHLFSRSLNMDKIIFWSKRKNLVKSIFEGRQFKSKSEIVASCAFLLPSTLLNALLFSDDDDDETVVSMGVSAVIVQCYITLSVASLKKYFKKALYFFKPSICTIRLVNYKRFCCNILLFLCLQRSCVVGEKLAHRRPTRLYLQVGLL